MLVDVRGVAPCRWHYFLQCDAVRHFPVRTKDQVTHVGGENRRLRRLECLSDNDVHLAYVRFRVGGGFEGEEAELRNIDDDGRTDEFRGEPAPALHGQFDLPGAQGERLGEFGEGRRSQYAVRLLAMAVLEMLDRVDQRRGQKLRSGGGLAPRVAAPHVPPGR